MARHEHDREDLLAEATALVERVSLQLAGASELTVIGFRRDACPSFYFGPDRAYHFTASGALRRAFVAGLLYKAERGRLVAMRRERTATAVELASRALPDEETREFLAEMTRHFDQLRNALASDGFTLHGQVPPNVDVLARVRDWLARFADPITIANSPRAGK